MLQDTSCGFTFDLRGVVLVAAATSSLAMSVIAQLLAVLSIVLFESSTICIIDVARKCKVKRDSEVF